MTNAVTRCRRVHGNAASGGSITAKQTTAMTTGTTANRARSVRRMGR